MRAVKGFASCGWCKMSRAIENAHRFLPHCVSARCRSVFTAPRTVFIWISLLTRAFAAPCSRGCARGTVVPVVRGQNLSIRIGAQQRAASYLAPLCLSSAARTACPSGLRGQTQVLLAQAAWVQIPLLSCRVSARRCAIVAAVVTEAVCAGCHCTSCSPQLRCQTLGGPLIKHVRIRNHVSGDRTQP